MARRLLLLLLAAILSAHVSSNHHVACAEEDNYDIGNRWRGKALAELTFVQTDTVDLDGDGTMESLSVAALEEYGGFEMVVSGSRIRGNLGDPVMGLTVIDIDTADSLKEIAVFTNQPSNDDRYRLYSFQNGSLDDMGLLEGWPRFTGDGTIIAKDWMGYWYRTDHYILTDDRRVRLVPQEFYYINISGVAIRPVPLYAERRTGEAVATVKPGERVTVVLSDHRSVTGGQDSPNWYCIMTANGLLAWMSYPPIYAFEGFQVAD
ncbi:MAG: hypothetical protein HOC74_39655 [Gemmatimonadetes bacterium]|jgi:hypothetical protein|nr:hypothetical protein [Gemmatimonadota bacterium]